MNKMYFILAVAGWAWLVVVAVFLVIRLRILEKRKRGFDVYPMADEPQPAAPETIGRH